MTKNPTAATPVFRWFTGGDVQYMTLDHCMRHDTPWIIAAVSLCGLVLAGYGIIAWHWSRNAARLADGPAKIALSRMRNIFLLCAATGYGFTIIKLFWPAWRLYVFVLAILAYQTIRYALSSTGLRVIYMELDDNYRLRRDLAGRQQQLDEALSRLNRSKLQPRQSPNDITRESP